MFFCRKKFDRGFFETRGIHGARSIYSLIRKSRKVGNLDKMTDGWIPSPSSDSHWLTLVGAGKWDAHLEQAVRQGLLHLSPVTDSTWYGVWKYVISRT